MARAINPRTLAVRQFQPRGLKRPPIWPCSRQSLPRFTPPTSRSSRWTRLCGT